MAAEKVSLGTSNVWPRGSSRVHGELGVGWACILPGTDKSGRPLCPQQLPQALLWGSAPHAIPPALCWEGGSTRSSTPAVPAAAQPRRLWFLQA